jgi:hypothetical protein
MADGPLARSPRKIAIWQAGYVVGIGCEFDVLKVYRLRRLGRLDERSPLSRKQSEKKQQHEQ